MLYLTHRVSDKWCEYCVEFSVCFIVSFSIGEGVIFGAILGIFFFFQILLDANNATDPMELLNSFVNRYRGIE